MSERKKFRGGDRERGRKTASCNGKMTELQTADKKRRFADQAGKSRVKGVHTEHWYGRYGRGEGNLQTGVGKGKEKQLLSRREGNSTFWGGNR